MDQQIDDANANPAKITLVPLIYAQPGPSQGSGRGGPTRVRDRSDKRAALLATVGRSPPVARGRPLGQGTDTYPDPLPVHLPPQCRTRCHRIRPGLLEDI